MSNVRLRYLMTFTRPTDEHPVARVLIDTNSPKSVAVAAATLRVEGSNPAFAGKLITAVRPGEIVFHDDTVLHWRAQPVLEIGGKTFALGDPIEPPEHEIVGRFE